MAAKIIVSIITYSIRAYSLVVRRGIRIAEAGVRFPLGPQKTQNPACAGFCAFVDGAALFLFEALRKAKTASRGREIFPSGKILVIHKIC